MSLKNFAKPCGTVSPYHRVGDAAREMDSNAIGTVVVVSDDYRPIGLLTDRDIAIRVVADGRNPEATPVETVMSQSVVSLPETASISAATERMRDAGVRRVVITDENGRVAGLVSLDDLLLLLGNEIGNLAAAVLKELWRPKDPEATAPKEAP